MKTPVIVGRKDDRTDSETKLADEYPDSPVHVIIAVRMLAEGWDVKNVYVIASMRASVSTILNEQTLGRGLRLPWGRYTDVEMLDTLEEVQQKRAAAKRWVNHVKAAEQVEAAGWRYVLLSETDIKQAKGSWKALCSLGTWA